MRDSGLQVRLDAPVEESAGRRAPAAGDPEGAVPRRAHPDPRRADRGADAAGDRAAVRHAAQPARSAAPTILLITHKLKEIVALTDAVTVMRAGRVVLDCATADTSTDALAQAMVGRRVQFGRGERRRNRADGSGAAAAGQWPAVARCRGRDAARRRVADAARRRDRRHRRCLGQRAKRAARCAVGLARARRRRAGAGRATLHADVAGSTRRPRASWRSRTCPKTASAAALVLPFAAWESAVLGYHARPRYDHRGWMMHAAMLADADGDDGTLRRAAARRTHPQRPVFRRQPAKARAGARSDARAQGAAGRAADTRRGHRRHRVHPRPPARDARRRRRGARRLFRTRRDPRAGRSRAGDELRPHQRRAADRRLHRERLGA